MAHYIDKSALVAEIEKFKENANKRGAIGKVSIIVLCNELLSFVDTLEVKEMNLEEKATQLSQKYFPNEENIWARPNIEAQRCKSACIEMVEWLKAQKGE